MIVSALVAGALLISLGLRDGAAAAVGSAVFAFSALVSYAANARQAGKVEVIPRLFEPERPATRVPQTVVLLAAEGEPASYDGPAYWARRFRSPAASAIRMPHWFVRPAAFGRIRAAYAAMGGHNPWNDAVARAAERLAERLGSSAYHCEAAFLLAPPTVDNTLVRLAKAGYDRVIILPLGLAEDQMEALREQVIHSRVRESGLRLSYVTPALPAPWPLGDPAARLAQLLASTRPPSRRAPDVVVAALESAVRGCRLAILFGRIRPADGCTEAERAGRAHVPPVGLDIRSAYNEV
jgi:hypothetical protein